MATLSSKNGKPGLDSIEGSSPLLAIFLAICALAPIVAFFQPKGMVPVLISAALFGALGIGLIAGLRENFPRRAAVVLALLIAWTGVTALWALDPNAALVGMTKLAGNLIVGLLFLTTALLVPPVWRSRLLLFTSVGWGIGLALVLEEIIFNGPIIGGIFGAAYDKYRIAHVGYFWLNGCATVLLMSAWPVATTLRQRYGIWPAVAALAVLLYALVAIQFWAGVIAICLGCVLAAATFVFKKQVLIGLAAIVVLFGLFSPVIAQHHNLLVTAARDAGIPIRESKHRLAIWAFAGERIAEHPIRGWGMNSSKIIPGGDEYLYTEDGEGIGTALPLHPHNGVLQIWLELGVFGAILFIAFILAIIRYIYRSVPDRYLAAIMVGQLTIALTLGSISFGIWQGWWMATLWFGAGLIAAVSTAYVRPTISEN